MANGQRELRAMIDRVRQLPDLGKRAAPDVAEAITGVLDAQVAAAETPQGKPWAPKKEGAGKPLANAAGKIRAVAVGARVFVRLRGVEARHSTGRVRGGVRRQILPDQADGVPPKMVEAIMPVLTDHYLRTVRGGQ